MGFGGTVLKQNSNYTYSSQLLFLNALHRGTENAERNTENAEYKTFPPWSASLPQV